MFIQVKLLNGFKEPLWYAAPGQERASATSLVGSIVQVPLQRRVTPAVVIHEQKDKPSVSFSIRSIERLELFPNDTQYWQFLESLAAYHALEPAYLVQRLKGFLSSESIKKQVEQIGTYVPTISHSETGTVSDLTDEQEIAYNAIAQDINASRYQATVLHGVTGSGKTEVYKKLMLDAFAQQKTTLFLVPEVTLALSFYARLKKSMPAAIPFYNFHSASTNKEKKALWAMLLAGKPVIIIGVHLPLLAPIANLGLIIVDEEHEVGYQEKKYPYIHSKDAAIMRAHTYKVPIVLGSATPSLRSLYNVTHKGWRLCILSRRYAGAFPTIQVVNLTTVKKRPSFWISTELHAAIQERLRKKEQTILFLNRRGFAFFVQCAACGTSLQCTDCSVSLTLHQDTILYCHYCTYKRPLPTFCPQCSAPESQFLKKGIGTQKVCALLQDLFPQARIARADLDTTKSKKEWQKTVEDFYAGSLDILVGTQTITKGYDFPKVTLVGILWADLNLHFPQYNATETTLQQLIQVAGRAGRHTNQSLVIVQTMSAHTVFSYIDELHYRDFCATEMRSRQEYGYPPYKQLCMLLLQHKDEATVEKDAHAITYALTTLRTRTEKNVQILGPSKPPVHKVQKVHLREIYLKAVSIHDILFLYNALTHGRYRSTISFMPGVV
jgi:primosomal protein N' (replication factor Y)